MVKGKRATNGRVLRVGNNYNNGLNGNNNLNNNARFVGIGQAKAGITIMAAELWEKPCSCENLELAYKKDEKAQDTKILRD